jgi:hypothetical protein
MAQLLQVVNISHVDLTQLALDRAKALIREETGKDPTGSSEIKFTVAGGPDKPESSCTVTFRANGGKSGR